MNSETHSHELPGIKNIICSLSTPMRCSCGKPVYRDHVASISISKVFLVLGPALLLALLFQYGVTGITIGATTLLVIGLSSYFIEVKYLPLMEYTAELSHRIKTKSRNSALLFIGVILLGLLAYVLE